MNNQDNNLPEFTYEDYLRDMSEYFMLQTYKTGNMPTIQFSIDDDINPTTVPEVNNDTITIKIPREADQNLAYNKIINHCYEGVQLQIGNNNVTTVKIDRQPYSNEEINTECQRCNFETDKENYHKAIKGPDGNNFKLTVFGYSPEKNTQTVPVNGTSDPNTKEQDKVSNIDLLTGAFLQYMYSGFQDFPEYSDTINVDTKNEDELYLDTLLHSILYSQGQLSIQNGPLTLPIIKHRNLINLYKAYLEDGVGSTEALLNISKLLLISQTIGDESIQNGSEASIIAKSLVDEPHLTKNQYKEHLQNINLDEFETTTVLNDVYDIIVDIYNSSRNKPVINPFSVNPNHVGTDLNKYVNKKQPQTVINSVPVNISTGYIDNLVHSNDTIQNNMKSHIYDNQPTNEIEDALSLNKAILQKLTDRPVTNEENNPCLVNNIPPEQVVNAQNSGMINVYNQAINNNSQQNFKGQNIFDQNYIAEAKSSNNSEIINYEPNNFENIQTDNISYTNELLSTINKQENVNKTPIVLQNNNPNIINTKMGAAFIKAQYGAQANSNTSGYFQNKKNYVNYNKRNLNTRSAELRPNDYQEF